MKDFQGNHIDGGRQKSHDQCEDHSPAHAKGEGVAAPNRIRFGASQLEEETPKDGEFPVRVRNGAESGIIFELICGGRRFCRYPDVARSQIC
jgi:hypothetical protein